jgi:lactobin A/cerein 7B family class IIb bacteriocin
MTKIQNNDRVEMTSLQAIDQAELAQIEGGIGAFVAGFIIGAAFVAGVYVGIQLAKS